MRHALYTIRKRLQVRGTPYDNPHPYFFTLGGGDRRKNTEAAVAAVRRLQLTHPRIGLKAVGHYDAHYKADLLREAGHAEGEGFLEFHAGVDDETLVELYSGAIATIAPSHIEGFSLPVVESAVCGAPVIASNCGAQMELIDQADALFRSDDHQELFEKLETILRRPDLRAELVQAQAHIGDRFREDQVGARFWNAVAGALSVRQRRPLAIGGAKPRVAILSPYPPDQSGVARYTQLTIEAAARYVDIDLYTNADRPIFGDGLFHDAGRIGRAALVKGNYDSIISVIGNSHFHIPIFELFEEYGGPCILHDSRLTQIYYFRLGHEGFRDFARGILGRPVSEEEIQVWLQDRDVASLFVERILKRAGPSAGAVWSACRCGHVLPEYDFQ